jgi:hypothetical protein
MSAQQILQEAATLPLAERFLLAQELWQSLDAGINDADASSALSEAILRDEEISAGHIPVRSHPPQRRPDLAGPGRRVGVD